MCHITAKILGISKNETTKREKGQMRPGKEG
jgi:hypothetical protein